MDPSGAIPQHPSFLPHPPPQPPPHPPPPPSMLFHYPNQPLHQTHYSYGHQDYYSTYLSTYPSFYPPPLPSPVPPRGSREKMAVTHRTTQELRNRDANLSIQHISNSRETQTVKDSGSSPRDNKKKKSNDYHPPPPRQPRTAFICYADAKRDEIIVLLKDKFKKKTTQSSHNSDDHENGHLDVSPPPSPTAGQCPEPNEDTILEVAADLWGELSDHDRAFWDEEARNDKVRYVKETAVYQGPIEGKKRRAKKNPFAPKVSIVAFFLDWSKHN
jgi:hypothetical protein